MSPLDSTDRSRGILVHKPKADLVTALLGISLAALLIAIVLMLLEWNRFERETKATVWRAPATVAPLGTAPQWANVNHPSNGSFA